MSSHLLSPLRWLAALGLTALILPAAIRRTLLRLRRASRSGVARIQSYAGRPLSR